jgi:large subunit ribosomal protein L9
LWDSPTPIFKEKDVQLLLKKSVEKLGKPGDIVEVAPGYGRNYLLPQGFAVPVTDENLRLVKIEVERIEKEETQRRAELARIKKALEESPCTILAKATEEGHLYGSITATVIKEELAKAGIAIEEKWVHLDSPLREIGTYDVPIHLAADIETVLKVWIVAEDKLEGESMKYEV